MGSGLKLFKKRNIKTLFKKNGTTTKLLVNNTGALNLYRLGNFRRTCDFRLPPGSKDLRSSGILRRLCY
jgi:hypothetical protein